MCPSAGAAGWGWCARGRLVGEQRPGPGGGPSPYPSCLLFPSPSATQSKVEAGGRLRVFPALPPYVFPSFISEMKLEGKCNLRRPTKRGKKKEKSNQAASPLGLGTSLPAGSASYLRPSCVAAQGSEPGQIRTSLGSPEASGGGVPRAGRREDRRGGEPPEPPPNSGPRASPPLCSGPATPVSH